MLTSSRVLEHDLVIQAQSQFRHAREVAFHLYSSENLASNHVPAGIDLEVKWCLLHELSVVRLKKTLTHQQVDALNDVKEDFILPVSNSFASPRDRIRYGNGGPDDFKFMRFLSDVLL